jgi:hypothetical protein
VGIGTGVCLVCGFNIFGCVVLELEERQGLILFVNCILLAV